MIELNLIKKDSRGAIFFMLKVFFENKEHFILEEKIERLQRLKKWLIFRAANSRVKAFFFSKISLFLSGRTIFSTQHYNNTIELKI